ncbi:MFS transporter [Prescottella equi]|uniref:MFS transporter n=1 Tax=Rhodococcus hoagii TaxID=43767 RepID=UPI000A11CB41|nr:MFS transporter [Prescottella equi]MBM4588423.1 MFS transporter [Prescottella equi]ORJ93326.1 MFS transporter [Prescottella equi]BCN63296.1 MFS transporter [Prescottella equi]BCN73149.1 MFS transporter [Prescottella equi]
MDTPTPRPRHLTAARAAIFGVFGINGFLLAMWVVHIPAIEDRTNIAHSTLGSLLLLLALGAIAGMQLAGPLADRYGSRLLVALSGILLSIAVIGPGLASTAWQLGLALLVFGFANGALDVSMNSQAVLTEREYGRPIMSAFHGMFSIGGVVGSLVGAVTIGAGWSPAVTLSASSVLGLAAVALCTARLLPPSAHPQPEPHGQRRRGRYSPRVLALGAVAFALMLAEGVANDWSTLQVKEHLDVPASVAALAFGAFSLTMTVGRFTADRVSSALGPVAVVRYGTLIAAAGMATVVVSPWLPTTLLGWALFGLGLSGCVPQIFTAAGNLGAGAAGANMSRVVGMGYIGFLAGPATIGWLTHLVPLTVAMVMPLVCVLVAARFAGIVDRPATRAVAVG